MRKQFLALVLVASSLPLIAAPARDAAARQETRSRWEVMRSQSPRPTAIEWNDERGTPRAAYGLLSKPMTPNANGARGFIAENSALFQITDDELSSLSLVREFDSPAGRHVVFAQRYGGLRVEGAEIALHFNQNGEVIALNNSFLPAIELDTRPTAPPALARLRSKARNGETAELLIFVDGGKPRLAWREVQPTARETWELFTDAHSGELIVRRDMNRYVNGTGRIFNVNAVVATRNNTLRDNNNAASAVPTSAYSNVTLVNLAGNGFLDGTYASSSATKRRVSNSANNFIYDRSSDGFSEVMAYYYLDYAQRYIQSLGFNNINNRVQVFSANGTSKDNSWYSGSNKQLTFGTGGVDDAEDGEVVLHEYGHSIQDNQKPGFGTTVQAGAMGEGFSDYWAASVGAQVSGGFQDTCVADWDATSYSSQNPPCLRRVDTTKHYPESVVNQVHADGEIWSGALWQIRNALAPATADRIILQHHFMINVNATFNEAANALVTAAINLNLPATEVETVRTILRNRGFTVTV